MRSFPSRKSFERVHTSLKSGDKVLVVVLIVSPTQESHMKIGRRHVKPDERRNVRDNFSVKVMSICCQHCLAFMAFTGK